MHEDFDGAPCHPQGQVSFSRRGLLVASGLAALGMSLGVETIFPTAQARAALGPVIWPVGKIPLQAGYWGTQQDFGPRDGGFHNGHDFVGSGVARGTPVYAMAAGVVDDVRSISGGCGHHIWIQHDSGVRSRYLHLEGARLATLGASVQAGTKIGEVGPVLPGGCSTVEHLHLEIKVNGVLVNPYEFLEAHADNQQGGDMPTAFSTNRGDSTPMTASGLTLGVHPESFLSEREWPRLPYGLTAADNLAELAPGASIFDVDANFYISNLPVGESVHVRLARWDRVTNVKSGLPSVAIRSVGSGQIRAQYSTSVSLNQATHRLTMQAFATVPNVRLDYWGTSVLSW